MYGMTRKKKELPLLQGITITAYAAEGKALARVDDMVVFVPWAVPGDVVDLQVRRKKHSFMEADCARSRFASTSGCAEAASGSSCPTRNS